MWRDGEGKRGCGWSTGFRAQTEADAQHLLANWPFRGGNRGRIGQEFGTIEARSNEVTTASGGVWRLPARSNSICRSEAVERMMGKHAKIFSRTFRKSDAINTTFLLGQPGNGRGSAMVSDRKTRR